MFVFQTLSLISSQHHELWTKKASQRYWSKQYFEPWDAMDVSPDRSKFFENGTSKFTEYFSSPRLFGILMTLHHCRHGMLRHLLRNGYWVPSMTRAAGVYGSGVWHSSWSWEALRRSSRSAQLAKGVVWGKKGEGKAPLALESWSTNSGCLWVMKLWLNSGSWKIQKIFQKPLLVHGSVRFWKGHNKVHVWEYDM